MRDIGRDYVRKRRLLDAIMMKDTRKVGEVLGEVDGVRLQNLLDQPVDEMFNTALHLAVGVNFTYPCLRTFTDMFNTTAYGKQ